ncbi:MAG: flagellar hook-length control protein FliK [Burkholderiales bacterium]
MLNRLADRVRLRASAGAPAAPVHAITSTTPREFLVGEEVRAQVDSTQRGGLFRVLIENRPYLLRLPINAKSGDTILLTVTARDPKLQFEMNEYPSASAPTARLSDAARFITALLAESEKMPLAATALTGVPLLSGAPTNAGVLASALGNALAESGMFYESHLAQWVADERSLARLRHEPQAQLSPSTDTTGITVQSSTGDIHVVASAMELPVHRDALPIVRQQLETLDTGHVAWCGMVWAGQYMEWHVSDRSSHALTAPPERQWQTHLTLTLPRLGNVNATLSIGKRGVTIAVHASSGDIVSLLAAHRDLLQASLRDTGVNPLALTIESDGNT